MKNLVIFYSRKGQNYVNGSIKELKKGNAEIIAEDIKNAIGADLFEVETVKSYNLDYTECTNEAAEELRNNARPALRKTLQDILIYGNVFIVGPCWWGTYPMPMFTCLEGLDFNGKNVFTCMTHEGSGMGNSEQDLRKMLKGATFGKSLAITGHAVNDSKAKIQKWAENSVNK